MALYFVETTIGRYDLNGNLTLEHEEILKAYPAFQGYLSRVLVYLICRPTDALSPFHVRLCGDKTSPAGQSTFDMVR